MLLHSLTTTNPRPSPLFLRLRPNPQPPLPLLISIPQTNNHPSLRLKLEMRPERTVPRAKDKTFNVHVDVDAEEGADDMAMEMEERLRQFDRQVMRTGLLRECWRRRFHENARDKRMRKHREAALLRRKRRQQQRKGSFEEESGATEDDDDMWLFSDETFEQLKEDTGDSNPKLDSYFRDVDGQGTWQFLDGTSQSQSQSHT